MIPEVDDALRRLLRSGISPGGEIEVAFDAPTRDWVAQRNGPVVDAYLYDIREDTTRRERGAYQVRDERGVVVGRRQPPRTFRLSYLVTAWTRQAEDEHRLLSTVLGCLLNNETLAMDPAGAVAALGLPVVLTVAVPPRESRSIADLWSALGGDLKPSLDVVVTSPFPIASEYPAGPPVTEGPGVRARRLDEPAAADRVRVRRIVR